MCAQPPRHQSQYLPGQKSFPMNDEVIVFWDFKKYGSVLFCSVSPGMMCLCWLVVMILSYVESDKAGTNKATNSFTPLFLLQSLNLPHITLHRPANPCRLTSGMSHQEQTENFSKMFSLFFEILPFLSELKVQTSPPFDLSEQRLGFQKSLLLKALSQGIEKLPLITFAFVCN